LKQNDWYSILEYAIARTKNIVVIVNQHLEIEWVNESFSYNLLYSNDEVKGLKVDLLFSQGYPFQPFQHAEAEVPWNDKRGNRIWLQLNQFSTEVSDAAYMVFIANPISKWKTLEALSNEQEVLIDAFSNSLSEINIVLGHQLQIMAFNHYAAHFFWRYLRIKLQKGHSLLTSMPDWMKPYMTKQLYRAFENNRIKRKQYIQNFRKYFNLGFIPITRSGNDVMAVSFHAEDITTEEQYMKRLRKQKNQIEKIAWNNSHALRRPVANILGLSELLQKSKVLAGEDAYIINKIIESSVDLDRKVKLLSIELEGLK
jgi:nitrogen-specific signal transduction histidine kinase